MARIIANRNVSPGYYSMRIQCPGAAARSKPGQFVMVKAGSSIDPLLRRPFAVHRLCGETGAASASGAPSCIEILYRTVGKATLLLSRMKQGEDIDLLGPLGSGFSLPRQIEAAVLVAGGIGVAPLLPLAHLLNRRGRADATGSNSSMSALRQRLSPKRSRLASPRSAKPFPKSRTRGLEKAQALW